MKKTATSAERLPKKGDVFAEPLPGGRMKLTYWDGSQEITGPDYPFRDMSPEEVHAAALSDPDAQPLTKERLARMRRAPRVTVIRHSLRLTQEEFAIRYRIPLGTLRDWEQGRCEPDQATKAYLAVIAHEPELVRKALEAEDARPKMRR